MSKDPVFSSSLIIPLFLSWNISLLHLAWLLTPSPHFSWSKKWNWKLAMVEQQRGQWGRWHIVTVYLLSPPHHSYFLLFLSEREYEGNGKENSISSIGKFLRGLHPCLLLESWLSQVGTSSQQILLKNLTSISCVFLQVSSTCSLPSSKLQTPNVFDPIREFLKTRFLFKKCFIYFFFFMFLPLIQNLIVEYYKGNIWGTDLEKKSKSEKRLERKKNREFHDKSYQE